MKLLIRILRYTYARRVRGLRMIRMHCGIHCPLRLMVNMWLAVSHTLGSEPLQKLSMLLIQRTLFRPSRKLLLQTSVAVTSKGISLFKMMPDSEIVILYH